MPDRSFQVVLRHVICGSWNPSVDPLWSGWSGPQLTIQGGSHHLAADLFVLLSIHGGKSASSVSRWGCQDPGLSNSLFLRLFFWMSASVMVTVSCTGRLLWYVLRSSKHLALVLCDTSFSHMLYQYCSAFIVLPCNWVYTLDCSMEDTLFILLASASIVCGDDDISHIYPLKVRPGFPLTITLSN